MARVQRVALTDSFDANAVFVPAGHIGSFDEEKIGPKDTHLVDPAEMPAALAVVEVAAIAPTGPNPTAPQQLPAGAVQTPGGGYALPGKQLVGEVTTDAQTRIDDAGLGDKSLEAEVSEVLARIAERRGVSVGEASLAAVSGSGTTANNDDDDLVAGTVADVTADLGGKTDEQLNAIIAAENDRERPRAGVLNAVQAELDGRQSD